MHSLSNSVLNTIRTAVMLRKTTMNPAMCLGFGNTSSDQDQQEKIETFFDRDNYRWIIKCLDDGYHTSIDIIGFMEDYYNLLHNFTQKLTANFVQSKAKFKRQSTLSSYHTTKRAQFHTVGASENLAQLIQTRCDAIQQVTNTYRQEVERMYPRERFSIVRRHRRSVAMEESFKEANSEVRQASKELTSLCDKERRGKDALYQAQNEYQNLELDETTSKSKLCKANDRRVKRQNQLRAIQTRITRKENDLHQEQEIYRQRATEIYQQCRALEEERLNLIKKTLMQFNQAVHTTEYSIQLNAMYAELLSTIQTEQSTRADLDFWSDTYGISGRRNQSMVLETHENGTSDSESTSQTTNSSEENEITNQLVIETEED